MEFQDRDNANFGQVNELFESHDNMPNIFQGLSQQDRLELDLNMYAFQSSSSSPLTDAFPISNMEIRIGNRRPRKEIYGFGQEHQRLENMPHFGEPFKHLQFFQRLGCPKKGWINSIGRLYNQHFHQEITLKKYPKFSRNHSRRYDLAYFFLDDNKMIFIPWLKEIGKISPDF